MVAAILTAVGTIAGALVAALTANHVNGQVVIYLVGAVLVGALGATVGFFLSSRRNRHEGVALDNLVDALRKLPSDATSASEASAGSEEATGDRNV